MIINHNMQAMNTHRAMGAVQTSQSKSMEKLSSGYRINRAGDDAAGLAISEKMRGQIRGLDQASRNSQDAISMVQTAEGALNETQNILQRMRELSVQSATDTNTADDRTNIQDEIKQLGSEIDRIANTTEFNTKKLLNGGLSAATTSATGTLENTGNLGAAMADATTLDSLVDVDGNNLGIADGDVITASWSINGTTHTSTFTVSDISTDALSDITDTMVTEGSVASVATASGVTTVTADAAGIAAQVNGLSIEVEASDGTRKEAASDILSTFEVGTAASDVSTDESATFQIGANQGQTVSLSLNDMRASTLGVKDLQVGTQSQSATAIKVLDEAIVKVSSERSKLGATQNRLEHTISNLDTSAENLQASESRIRDVDMAAEMMEFTKNNILSQAAQSMLAQANQAPQGVLSLLR